jgi:hypothetical protein
MFRVGRRQNSGGLHHSRRLETFGALHDLEPHLFARAERFKPIAEDSRIVNENILTARLLDEPVTLLRIKPFHEPISQTVTLLFRNELS